MRLVLLVEWVDSYGCSPSWHGIDDPLPQPRIMTCLPVGWLAPDGEECTVLIPHVAKVGGDEPEPGCGEITIPTRAVVRIADLMPLDRAS